MMRCVGDARTRGDNSNLFSVYVRRRILFRFIHPFRRVKRFYRLNRDLI